MVAAAGAVVVVAGAVATDCVVTLAVAAVAVCAVVVAVVPVPVSVTACEVGVPVLPTVIVAVLVPATVGVNVTPIVQLAPTARLLGSVPQVLLCLKSAAFVPARAMLFTVCAVVPLFLIVTDCTALVVVSC